MFNMKLNFKISFREEAELLYFDLNSKVEQVRINAIRDARALQGQPEEEL